MLFANPEDRFSRVVAKIILYWYCTKGSTAQDEIAARVKNRINFLTAFPPKRIYQINNNFISLYNLQNFFRLSSTKWSPELEIEYKAFKGHILLNNWHKLKIAAA